MGHAACVPVLDQILQHGTYAPDDLDAIPAGGPDLGDRQADEILPIRRAIIL